MNLDAMRQCSSRDCRLRPDGSTLHSIACIHWHPEVMDLIDEVERLRGLVLEGHGLLLCEPHADGIGDDGRWLGACACGDLSTETDYHDTEAGAEAAHAAHLAALLEEGAK